MAVQMAVSPVARDHASTRNDESHLLVAGIMWAMPVTSGCRMGEELARGEGEGNADAPRI
jgi:hypothetical protein